MLVRGLSEEGFEGAAAAAGAELLRRVENFEPQVVVIDIGLPDSDGRDVCQALRARGVNAPVLFLTARAALTDRLSGFHAGGDDYLVKPFAFKELVVRLHALSPRGGGPPPGLLGDRLPLRPPAPPVRAGGPQGAPPPSAFPGLPASRSRPGERGAGAR